MAEASKFTPLSFTNGSGQAINASVKNEEHRVVGILDQEMARSQSVRLNDYKEVFYQTNVFEVDQFQDSSLWTPLTASSTLSDDTTNYSIGQSSVRFLENDDVAGYIGIYKTISSIDLEVFNDGSASDSDDNIAFVVYISDYTKFTQLTLKLGTDNSNNYSITYDPSNFSNPRSGWWVFFPQKKDFTTNGSPAGWDDITFINCQAYTVINAQNEYISIQLVQLVRKDPDQAGYINSFQLYQGTVTGWENAFDIAYDSYLLYNDPILGELGIQRLDPFDQTGNEAGLHLYCSIISFIAKFEVYCKKEGFTSSIVWWSDADNYIEVSVDNDDFYLEVYEGGVLTDYYLTFVNSLLINERFQIYFEKNIDTIRAIFKKDGEAIKILEHETTIDSSAGGCIYLGAYNENSFSLITDFMISNTQGNKLESWDIPKIIKKIETQTVNNDSVLGNDDELFCHLPSNGIFEIEFNLAVSGAANADFKSEWALTGSVEQLTTKICIGPATSTTGNADTNTRISRHNLTTDISYGCDGSTAAFINEKALVKTGKTGGKIQFRWSQNTAQVSDTAVSSSSYMKITKIKM